MLSSLCDSSCTRCALYERAKTVCVPGRGAESAIRLLIIGEAPGPQEDKEGLPFVGPSGELLEKLIEEAGLDNQYIRYENIVRCLPTKRGEQGVRPPEPQEIEACLPYLSKIVRQIVEAGSKPLLVATGNSALQALTGFAQITRNRGRFLPLKAGMEDLNLTVMGMIHPAAVLRGQEAYRPLIAQDLAAAWSYGGETTSLDYSGEYVWGSSLECFRSWVEAVIEDFQTDKIHWVSFDTETTGFSPYDSSQRLVCFSFCAQPRKAIVVPLYHKDSPWKDDPISIKEVRDITARLFSIVPICGWNLSFDLKWIKLHMDLSPIALYDGFLGSRWLYGSKRPDHRLNTLADQILGFRGHGHAVKVELAAIRETTKRHYGNLSRDTLLQYAGGDTDAALQLCGADYQRMQSVVLTDGTTMLDKFNFIQTRALPTLVRMEMNGVKVSRETNEYLKVEYVKMMKPLEDKVALSTWGQQAAKILQEQRNRKQEALGKAIRASSLLGDPEVNLKSVDYVRCLLFDAMEFTAEDTGIKKLPKTGPPTAKQAIDALIELCSTDERYFIKREILEALREWKLLKHNYNNFIKNAENYIFDDGCFHTQYNIAGAECLAAGELVLTNRGYLPVQEVSRGDNVLTHERRPRKVIDCVDNGIHIIYKITLESGLTLRTTANHPFLLANGSWVTADRLVLGDSVNVHSKPEEWRPIPEWQQFFVSSWGRVANLATRRVLALQPKGEWGHLKATLSRNGAQERGPDRKDFPVHRLVAQAFLRKEESQEQQLEVRHLDGIAWVNTVENLGWGTSAENSLAPFSASPVVAIDIEEAAQTYGLVVEEDHSHITGGIITHNTGRMSTYQPSLHGTPKGSMVRWQFVSRWQNAGGLIVSADASQMEIRVLAILSGDENLAATLASGLDIHQANAAKMFRVPFDKVNKSLRQRAKTAGFAVLYGATATTVAAQIKSSLAEAEEVIASWYRAYPKTREFQSKEWRQAKKYGHTYTPFGRIRWLEGIKEAREGSHVWRQALNTAIQSVASDLVLIAIIEIVKEIEERSLRSLPFGFIHDAVVSDVHPGELWDILEIKKRRMETYLMQAFPWITVPIVAEFDICPGWGFPCEVKSFTNAEIHLAGPSPHMALLARETAHLIGVSYEIVDRWKDDKGQEQVKAILRRSA